MAENQPKKKAGGPKPPGGFSGNLLNLERVPGLAPKFANQLGKTSAGFSVEYTVAGNRTMSLSMLDSEGALIVGEPEKIPLLEWERRRALHNAPSETEKLSALKRKYELRLNSAFPQAGPSSGSDEDIASWMQTLGFAQRRALLMSQKDFTKSYPEGFRA